jgi:hypothetical protein
MSSMRVRDYLRSHVLGVVAIFIALTGTAIAGSNDGPPASSSAVTTAKFKKLKQRVGALESKLNSGVTGDLTGTFPNLRIGPSAVTSEKLANNAVTETKLADNAVTTTKIKDDAVNDAKLATDSVGSAELKTVNQSQSALQNVTAGTENVQSIACGAGQQVLGGGGLWDSVDVDLRMLNSFPSGNTWTMNGINQDAADHGIRAMATCLAP